MKPTNHLSHIIQSDICYESLAPEFFAGVIALGNHVHGDNYLTNELLADYYAKSFVGNTNASWVALYKQKVVGFRLTFACNKKTIKNPKDRMTIRENDQENQLRKI